MGARSSLGVSRGAKGRRSDPCLACRRRRGHHDGLGLRHLHGGTGSRPGRWGGLGQTLRHYRMRGSSGSAPDAFSPSWGPMGAESSRGALSSSSTTMWETGCPPPGAWVPSGAS